MSIKVKPEDPVSVDQVIYPPGLQILMGPNDDETVGIILEAHISGVNLAVCYDVAYWGGSARSVAERVSAVELKPIEDLRVGQMAGIGFHSQEIPEAEDCPSCGRLMERICPSCVAEEPS